MTVTHRGVNNDFLIRSSDPLALLYNDASPLENHHVAAAFTLMHEEPYAFFPTGGDGNLVNGHCTKAGPG